MKKHAFLVGFVSFAAMILGPSAHAAERELFAVDASAPTPRSMLDTSIARAHSVAFDATALEAPTTSVHLQLFDDREATLILERRVDSGPGRFTWLGRVTGDALGSASFAVSDGAISGTVRLQRELFRVHGTPDGRAIVEEVDEARMPPCATGAAQRIVVGGTPPSHSGASASTPSGSSSLAAAGATVDVLVVWTPQARAGQGGTAAMQALIDLAVLETNTAYQESGVLQRLRLVHRDELVGFVESGNFATDMGRVQNPSDGIADEVHGWRTKSGADCVVLIVDAGGSCGVAYLMGTLDPAWTTFAFCAVARNCATGFYTFGHELGHVMGLAHDRDNSSDKTTRISTNQQLQPANQPSYSPAISTYGTYVAFVSDASNLVTNDTNGLADVFMRDRANRTTTRLNLGPGGVQANGVPQSAPSVSVYGRFIAFDSTATNLVASDTNGVTDVFVRDVQLGLTTRVSVATGGVQANGASYLPGISEDGRFVAFTSDASNLVAGASGTQVYVFDRNTSTTVLASVNTSATAGAGISTRASLSTDGRLVAFMSTAADLVPLDLNGKADVFVRDLVAGTTVLASVDSNGVQGDGHSPYSPAISNNGRFVVFSSGAQNLVANDTNGWWDVFVRDLTLGTTVRASVGPLGVEATGPSGWVSRSTISADGRYVAFLSRASNLVVGDTNGVDDVFVHDLQLGVTQRVSVTPSGIQGGAPSGQVDSNTTVALAAWQADSVAFVSSSVLETLDTNGLQDVYVHQRIETNAAGVDLYSFGYRTPDAQWRTIMAYAPGTRVQRFSNPSITWAGQALGIADPDPFSAEAWRTLNNTAATVAAWMGEIYTPFCFGDGTATACPCGNASALGAGSGCVNSLSLAGKLDVLGVASIAADSVVLRGSGMPDSSALYFQGSAEQNAGAGAVFGDGLRCAGGSIRRLRTKTNSSNASTCPSSGDPALSSMGAVAVPSTQHYQAWYRNSASFCTSSNFNLTNGLSIAWQL